MASSRETLIQLFSETIRTYQNPRSTASAQEVWDALDINQKALENWYADQVAGQNLEAALKSAGESHLKG